MAQAVVADIRLALAENGIEFTTQDLEDMFNLAASLAAYTGGYICFDCGEFWGIELEIDPEDPGQQRCDVNLLLYDVEDDDGLEAN